jgi:O-Antigen ligase
MGLVGSFFTWKTNLDVLHYGPHTIQAHAFPDFQGEIVRLILDPWITFYLGRILYKSSRDLSTLVRLLTIAMLVYTLPILYEIRMSPQINHMIYGYTPGQFDQALRWGGYRPIVCFPTGIHLTAFLLACAMMVAAAARSGKAIGKLPMRAVTLYLVAMLVLCKSTGAIIYGLLFIPLIAFGSPRRMLTVAKVIGIFFLLYPFLRINNMLPTKSFVDLFTSLSADRAESLAYRFDMEQGLIDLTRMRPWFGWGGWGRPFVYDPITGRLITVVDGAVIITLASHGLVGFLTYFLPYGYTVVRAARLVKKIKSRSDKIILSGLALTCSVFLVDLIVNSAFFPVFMLLTGALYGLPSGIIAEEKAAEAAGWQEPPLEEAYP